MPAKHDGTGHSMGDGTGAITGDRTDHSAGDGTRDDTGQQRLLSTLERLLAINATNIKSALNEASNLIADAICAEKTDVFIYEPSSETLVAMGTSNTPMGIRQHEIGLNRLPIANGGVEVFVFQSGDLYDTGHADKDPLMLIGPTKGLGVRSTIVTPLDVDGVRRGVLQASSSKEEAFSEDDVKFLKAVSQWVGAITHRAELIERIAAEATQQARQVVAEELVTTLAHDLRNYITPVQGRLSLILGRARKQDRPRDIEDAESAARSMRRISNLIDDLLDTARLDHGILELDRQPLDLVTLEQETLGMLQTNRLDTILRAPDELRVEADPKRMRQVIENLVANALRYTPKGGQVEVELRSEKRDDGEWATIEVMDQGPGIALEVMPRLFTRFSSGPDKTGLGLGLYLAHSIARAHGGDLTVTSAPGQGASFCLSIPML